MQLFWGAWRDFRRNVQALIAFSLAFRLISAALLAPVSAWTLSRLIASTGELAIGNDDLVRFALSPYGVAAALLFSGFFLATLFTEQAGILNIAEAGYESKPATALGAAWSIFRAFPRLLKLGLTEAVLYGLAATPFLIAAGFAYSALLTDHDIYYYVTIRPRQYWIAVGIGSVLALGLAAVWGTLYVRWCFAVAIVLWEKKNPLYALRRSRRLIRPLFWKIVAVRLGWLAAVLLCGLAAAFVLDLIGKGVLTLAGSRIGAALPAVALLLSVEAAVAIVIAFVSITVHCHLVARLYHQSLRECGERDAIKCDLAEPTPRATTWRYSPRLVFWSAVALVAFGSAPIAYGIVATLDLDKEIQITAHRGAASVAPENTLAAIKAAIDAGADYAEIDVQETADGVVVVLHDEDLLRITGLSKRIWEVDYDEIKDLDAGRWFSEEFAGEPIPTLEQVLQTARGRIKLNIELKYNGHDQELARRTIDLVRKYDFVDDCVISSLRLAGLHEVQSFEPALEVGFIIFRTIGAPARVEVDFLSVNASLASKRFIAEAHRRGRDVHVWNVKSRETAMRLIDRGADNLIVDDPREFVLLRSELEELTNVERVLLAIRHRRLD